VVDTNLDPFADLPGYEIVGPGVADLRAGTWRANGLLVTLASARLRAAGIALPAVLPDRAKDTLWELLEAEVGDDVHARYNALMARVLSFVAALEFLNGPDRPLATTR
jgi:hypothetical protein